MSRDVTIGTGLDADDDVRLGYPSSRSSASGLSIGSGARIRSGTVIYAGTSIGDRFQAGHHVVVREDCWLGDDVAIWSNAVVDYGCRIGSNVKIHANCYVAQFTEIEEGAFLAPGVTVANDLYPGSDASREVMSGPYIGAGAQIGVNVTILPFVRIGAGCLVGAGAVVTRDLPQGTVAYGNPAVPRGRVQELSDVRERVAPASSSAQRFRLAAPTQASAVEDGR